MDTVFQRQEIFSEIDHDMGYAVAVSSSSML